MTFMPPDANALGDPLPPAVEPGNIDPQNFPPGFTPQDWEAMQANLDSHYNALYGSDPGAGSPPDQTGTQPPGEPVVGIGTQPPAPSVPVPPPPTEYSLGQVMVSAEDASSLGALYALIRNDPVKGQQILDIVRGTPPQPPQVDVPIWQQQPPPAPPAYQPQTFAGLPYAQQPTTPGVQIVPPEVIESADPLTRLMYERFTRMEQQQQQMVELQQRQQAAQVQAQQRAALEASIARNAQLGVARFRQAHPEITDDQLAQLNMRVQELGITGALSAQLPGDQAVAKAFELARLDLASSLTGVAPAGTMPADARRQATLTSLSGGSSGSVPRQEPPPPLDTAPDPTLSRAKAAAVDMLRQQGINLADHM